MKQLLSIAATVLLAVSPALGLVTDHTNTVNLTLANVCDGTFNDFKFGVSGYDDQYFRFGFDQSLVGMAASFRITKPMDGTIYLDVPVTSVTIATTNVTFSIARSNIPPPGSYYGELLSYQANSTNYYRSLAQGKISCTWSLYLNASNFFASVTKTNAAVGQVYVHPSWVDPPWLSSTGALGTVYVTITAYDANNVLQAASNTLYQSFDTAQANTNASNAPIIALAMTNLINAYSDTSSASFTGHTLTFTHGTNAGSWPAVSNTVMGNADKGATAYGWSDHASFGYLSATQSIYAALTIADRSQLNTNIAGLTQGVYTGLLTSVSYTGVTVMVVGRRYAWGYTKIGANGTSTLSIASQSLATTSAGNISNHFSYAGTDTNLILKLDGNGLSICNVSNVYVRQITGGTLSVAGNLNVGGDVYLGKTNSIVFPDLAQVDSASIASWNLAVTNAIAATNLIGIVSNAFVAANTVVSNGAAGYANIVGTLVSNAHVAANTVVSNGAAGYANSVGTLVSNAHGAADTVVSNGAAGYANSVGTLVSNSANAYANSVGTLVSNAFVANDIVVSNGAVGYANAAVTAASNSFGSATNAMTIRIGSLEGATNELALTTLTNGVLTTSTSNSAWFDGRTWNITINTNYGTGNGTFDHVALTNQNGDTNFLHVSLQVADYGPWMTQATEVAIGDAALATGYGVAVGQNSDADTEGVGIGDGAQGQTYGVSIGRLSVGSDHGVGVGEQARGGTYGVAIGRLSQAASNSVAIGQNVTNDAAGTTRILGNLNLAGASTTNGSFIGDGSGLTNLSATYDNTALNDATNNLNIIQIAVVAATNAINTVANAAMPKAGGAFAGAVNHGANDSTNIGVLSAASLAVTGGSPTNGARFTATNNVGQGTWSRATTKRIVYSTQTTNTTTPITITGVGFRPAGVTINAIAGMAVSGFVGSWGQVDGDGVQGSVHTYTQNQFDRSVVTCLTIVPSAGSGASYNWTWSTWTDDGATFNVTATTASTNNIYIHLLFYP